jgi:hypothetical protein
VTSWFWLIVSIKQHHSYVFIINKQTGWEELNEEEEEEEEEGYRKVRRLK